MTDGENMVAETESLLHEAGCHKHMAKAVNPIGDRHAADRIVDIILEQMS